MAYSAAVPFRCAWCKSSEIKMTGLAMFRREGDESHSYKFTREHGVVAAASDSAVDGDTVIIEMECSAGHKFWGIFLDHGKGVTYYQAVRQGGNVAPQIASAASTTTNSPPLEQISKSITAALESIGAHVKVVKIEPAADGAVFWAEYLALVKDKYPLIHQWLVVAEGTPYDGKTHEGNGLCINFKPEHQMLARACNIDEHREALASLLSEMTKGLAKNIRVTIAGKPIDG